MSKRANGEGSISQRKDGRWVGRLSFGKDENGKRIQKSVYGKTQAECVEKLEDLKAARKLNLNAVIAKDSVAGYLQSWLSDVVAVNNAGKTYEEYEAAIRLLINPFIGHVKLRKLNGEQLQKWQARMKRGGFTPNQRLRSIRVLRNALNKAVKNTTITVNPCNALDIPKVDRREVSPLEPEVCHRLFDECKANRLGDAITLAIMTGMRLREIFALDWSAVNLREGVLSVRKTVEELQAKTAEAIGAKGRLNEKAPKTKKSKRVITLEPIAIEALMNRLEKAKAEGFEPDAVPIVFPNTLARRLRISSFNQQCWHPIREAVGIQNVKFHDLRHTQASLMLYAEVDMKVIQERLGHSSYATTANMYAHLMQNSQARASDRLANLMAETKPSEKLVSTNGEYTKEQRAHAE